MMNSRTLPLFLALAFCGAGLAAETSPSASAKAGAFHPPGMWTWDNWFVREGNTWHAFYLQLPQSLGVERRWKNNDPFKHVGHATSTDLRHWNDQGPALTAMSGTWNDRHIATGSIIKHDDQWWMFFTGRGYAGDGIGVALSKDLYGWTTQSAPLFPLTDTFGDGTGIEAFKSQWQGQPVSWVGISDPYIVPEKRDGWFYMVLCSRIVGEPIASSGCLTMVKSRDLLKWEDAGVLAWPKCFERMETPQIWQAEGRFYVYFGGVINAAINTKQALPDLPAAVLNQKSHQNYVYTSDSFAEARTNEQLHHITTPSGHFIMKVLPSMSDDGDFAIYTVKEGEQSSISVPYKVVYPPAGGVTLVTP